HHLLPQFTVPATGTYRLSGSFWVSQAAACTVTISIAYTPGFSGGTASIDYLITNGTSGAVAELDGSVTVNGTGAFQLVPWTGYLAAGSTFEVDYKDATTTPNDAIVLVLERLT
ncbi:MAG TPA: hypothetical protein VFU63_00205, partial [Ktedonobacterales bacterium]|nr:hypothetical protein [Ktedonobacterales bacterium]